MILEEGGQTSRSDGIPRSKLLIRNILTIPVAKYQRMIVMGKATIYRIRRVKLQRRKKLPTKPQASDAPLSPRHHFGSGMGTIRSSIPGSVDL